VLVRARRSRTLRPRRAELPDAALSALPLPR